MKMEIKALAKQDYGKAMKFAIPGMHLHWYLKNKLLLALYARYFFYLELGKATEAIGAYLDGELVGVLLAEIYGETKVKTAWWQTAYVWLFNRLQKLFAGSGVGEYDQVNQDLLDTYLKERRPCGEIVFLASDLAAPVKGIGTKLLNELKQRARGKEVFLYTDSGCTYQFYEKRGFTQAANRQTVVSVLGKKQDLTAMLYWAVL